MNVSPATVCTRCNQAGSDVDKCAKCGTRVQPLERVKRRGWVAFGAGVFLAVLSGAVWVWVNRLLASQAADPATAQFLGRMNLAFGLVLVSGLLGIANGWMMAHTGRRNRPLIFGLVIAFVIAFFVALSASQGYQPS
jgi:uncharacterized membrane protein